MKPSVTIVSIGPGDEELLNTKTINKIKNAENLILRTAKHPFSNWLKLQGIPFYSMDCFYDSADSFDQLFNIISSEIWKSAETKGPVVYAVSDVQTDHSVDSIFRARPENGIVEVVPGFSYADFYLSGCRDFFSTSDIRICSAYDFIDNDYDPTIPFLITELNDEITASEIKNSLSLYLDDESTLLFLDENAVPKPVALFELDRQAVYNHLSAVAGGGYSFSQRNKKTFSDLVRIMDFLRSPGEGCPWDQKQTHKSLKPYLIEEAWEVVDSIDEQDPFHLAEELGDLLFQIVFHSSIGKSFDEFTITDVITEICNKMIRRHPNVFVKNKNRDSSSPMGEWEQIKRKEKGDITLGDSFDSIPSSYNGSLVKTISEKNIVNRIS